MRFNTTFQNYEYYANGAWFQSPNNKYDGVRAPTEQDSSGFAIGSTWFWGDRVFVCVDATSGSADWMEIATEMDVQADHPGVAIGRYYGTATDGMMSTYTFSDSVLYAIPCQFPAGYTFNRIGVETISRHTGYNVRLGIYSNVDGSPSSLLLDAGIVSASTVGLKEIVTNFTTDGDWFWLVCNLQTDMILRSMKCPSWVAGGAVLGRMVSGGDPVVRVSATQAYGPLPSTFPASKTASADDAPQLWLRKV